jgi:hypothetical protein
MFAFILFWCKKIGEKLFLLLVKMATDGRTNGTKATTANPISVEVY